MEKDYQILEYLQESEYTTQRSIAEKTGLSLGTVNILLKRMIKKGLVKTERLNARSLRYIVTPKGLSEKMKLTYHYVKNSYAYIIKIVNLMEEIILDSKTRGFATIFLYGPDNEVYEILQIALKENDAKYLYIKEKNDLPDDKRIPLIVWDLEDEKSLKDYRLINILRLI